MNDPHDDDVRPRTSLRQVGDELPPDELAIVDELTTAFPEATWVDNYRPGPYTIELDLRPPDTILNQNQLAAELAEWGSLDYRCPLCGEHFVAASLFDAHRVADATRPGGRRCRGTDEPRHGEPVPERGIWRSDRDPGVHQQLRLGLDGEQSSLHHRVDADEAST